MKKKSVFSLILYLGILALVLSFVLGLFSGLGDELTHSQVVETR